jgi:hypothetical protein
MPPRHDLHVGSYEKRSMVPLALGFILLPICSRAFTSESKARGWLTVVNNLLFESGILTKPDIDLWPLIVSAMPLRDLPLTSIL